MREGIRGKIEQVSTWKIDGLWAAACKEKTALDLEAAGDLAGARYFMDWCQLQLKGFPTYVSELGSDGRKSTVPAPASRVGKALLAKLNGEPQPTQPQNPWAEIKPSRVPDWAP